MPDGLPWKIVSASSTAASIARVVRRAPARRRRRARHRHRQRRRAAQPRARRNVGVGVEVERRAPPAGARSPPARRPTALSSPAVASRPQAGTRRRPLPGRAVAVDPDRQPRGQRRVSVDDRVLADEDHLAVAGPATAVALAAHRGLCASHCASSPVITRGAVARSRARRHAAQQGRRAHAVDDLRRGTPRRPRARLVHRAQRRLRQPAQTRAQRQRPRDVEPAADAARRDDVDARAGTASAASHATAAAVGMPQSHSSMPRALSAPSARCDSTAVHDGAAAARHVDARARPRPSAAAPPPARCRSRSPSPSPAAPARRSRARCASSAPRKSRSPPGCAISCAAFRWMQSASASTRLTTSRTVGGRQRARAAPRPGWRTGRRRARAPRTS